MIQFDGLTYFLSNFSPVISIIISTCALMISILSYTNNKKETNVLMEKERNRLYYREAVEALIVENETLKSFSNTFYFTNIDSITIFVIQQLCSKDEISLSINYEKLIINDNVIIPSSFNDSKEFVAKVRDLLISFWREGEKKRSLEKKSSILYFLSSLRKTDSGLFLYYQGPDVESSISFTMKSDSLYTDYLKFDDLFFNFAKLENDISNLTRVQYLIEPYDPDFYALLEENYECIFKILYEAFRKQGHEIKLTKNMAPQEIKDALYRTVNYEQIIEKITFISSDLRERGNKLKKEITVQNLNK
jgi:hypothetical protein